MKLLLEIIGMVVFVVAILHIDRALGHDEEGIGFTQVALLSLVAIFVGVSFIAVGVAMGQRPDGTEFSIVCYVIGAVALIVAGLVIYSFVSDVKARRG